MPADEDCEDEDALEAAWDACVVADWLLAAVIGGSCSCCACCCALAWFAPAFAAISNIPTAPTAMSVVVAIAVRMNSRLFTLARLSKDGYVVVGAHSFCE